MKKVLLVGYDYVYTQAVIEKYNDILFIPQKEVNTDTPQRIIELVRTVDEVIFISSGYMEYEVAAVMLNKPVYWAEHYPVDDVITADQAEEDNNESF